MEKVTIVISRDNEQGNHGLRIDVQLDTPVTGQELMMRALGGNDPVAFFLLNVLALAKETSQPGSFSLEASAPTVEVAQ